MGGEGLPPRRIVTLIPEAAEILDALGLGDQVVALPERDAAEPERLAEVLRAAAPTLIFTSETAAGGGVPRQVVRRAVAALRPRPAVYALEPRSLGDILADIKTVGDATGRQADARALIEALRARIDAVSLRSAQVLAEHPPTRVACLQQSEPPVAAGWWLADLVGLAGGLDVFGGVGRPPRPLIPAEIEAARPDLVVVAQRGGWGVGASPLTPGPRIITLMEDFAARILRRVRATCGHA
jgi:iron complex transport system substrate-binding protein